VFRFAVKHVPGLICKASPQYAQGFHPARAQWVSPGFRASTPSGQERPPGSRCACAALRCAPLIPLLLRSRFKGGAIPSRCTCYPCVRQVASGM
jgi:hypothetical protein